MFKNDTAEYRQFIKVEERTARSDQRPIDGRAIYFNLKTMAEFCKDQITKGNDLGSLKWAHTIGNGKKEHSFEIKTQTGNRGYIGQYSAFKGTNGKNNKKSK